MRLGQSFYLTVGERTHLTCKWRSWQKCIWSLRSQKFNQQVTHERARFSLNPWGFSKHLGANEWVYTQHEVITQEHILPTLRHGQNWHSWWNMLAHLFSFQSVILLCPSFDIGRIYLSKMLHLPSGDNREWIVLAPHELYNYSNQATVSCIPSRLKGTCLSNQHQVLLTLHLQNPI